MAQLLRRNNFHCNRMKFGEFPSVAPVTGEKGRKATNSDSLPMVMREPSPLPRDGSEQMNVQDGDLERKGVIDEADFEIKIPNVLKQGGEQSSETLSQEVMLKKAEACRIFRQAAHALLAHLGAVDPFIEDVKLQKIQRGFKQRFDSTMEQLRSTVEASATGPLSLVLGKLFRDYWNEQGVLATFMAKLNKQRMGELEHAFVLKTLSQKMEEATTLLEQADTVEQARFQNDILKQYLRVIVEWDNEYQRLYRSVDMNKVELDGIYEAIEKTGYGLGQVLIADKYVTGDVKGNGELAKERELDVDQDSRKKLICAELLEGARRIPAEQSSLIIPILIEIDGTSDIATLAKLANQFKRVMTENSITIYSRWGDKNLTRNIEEIEALIRDRKKEVF